MALCVPIWGAPCYFVDVLVFKDRSSNYQSVFLTECCYSVAIIISISLAFLWCFLSLGCLFLLLHLGRPWWVGRGMVFHSLMLAAHHKRCPSLRLLRFQLVHSRQWHSFANAELYLALMILSLMGFHSNKLLWTTLVVMIPTPLLWWSSALSR